MNKIVLDIETIPSQLSWVADYIGDNTKPPATIKKPESIEKWYEESFEDAKREALNKTSFDGAMNHIICIGCAVNDSEPVSFSAKNIDEEKTILIEFYSWLQNVSSDVDRLLIGHNIIGFDMRVIRQRSIILGVTPPGGMHFNAKPWDANPYDTMTQWDSKNFISLDKLSKALGLSGKDNGEIKGSTVYSAWQEGKHDEIAAYCRDDVSLTRQVYNKMKIIF